MARASRFFNRSYWRKRAYRFSTRYVIRPAVALRGIPLVAVTGTNGKTAVTLLINRILTDAGYRTGVACSEGVLVDGRWLERVDSAGARGLWRAGRVRGLDAVAAETARGGILRNGLGFFRCHVGIVTNVTADHLGLGGVDSVERMAELKAAVAAHTRADGATVRNLDQPLVRAMANRSRAQVLYFTLGAPPASAHDCFFVRDGHITRKRRDEITPLFAVKDVYLTLGGHVTFQIANALAAIAAIEALQRWLPVPAASLARSLGEFGRDPRDLPMRFQLFRRAGVDVLLSTSKNPETYTHETALIRRLASAHGYRRVVCVLSNVGNRQLVHYRAVSRIVAELADALVCVAPVAKYLRGRSGSEIVELLEREVPADKRMRLDEVSLATLQSRFSGSGADPTLFVLFASQTLDKAMIEDILSHGERLPMRFAP